MTILNNDLSGLPKGPQLPHKIFSEWLAKLKKKWGEVPGAGSERITTEKLLNMSDKQLCDFWLNTCRIDTENHRFAVRGWYHALYKDIFADKKILDVGSGLGIDGLTFANNGAKVTCVDIVDSNIELIQRISSKMKIDSISFLLLESLNDLKSLPNDFDAIWCQGSMINVPLEIASIEAHELLKHLKPDGRWIELAYPKARWEREGKMPFDRWGEKTDGGAPWIEWYNLEKILKRLAPVEFETLLYFEFHNSDFNWFDLKRRPA